MISSYRYVLVVVLIYVSHLYSACIYAKILLIYNQM
jgi:hypothetical protein